MTDKEKLEKVKAEIERRKKLHEKSLINPIHEGFGLQNVIKAKISELTYLHSFIDFMQKEPKFKVGDRISFKHYKENRLKIINVGDKGYYCEDGTFLHFDNQYLWELVEPQECMYSKDNYTDEDRKVLCDGCEEECRFNKKEEPVSEELEVEVKKLWEEINTGHNYSIIDSYNQFYGLCLDIAEWQKQKDSIPVSEDLEEAGKGWLKPQLDKSYANYGEAKMMELTHFDGYAMLDAIEYGIEYGKQQMLKNAVSGHIGQTVNGLLRALSDEVDDDLGFEAGNKVKLIIIKEV